LAAIASIIAGAESGTPAFGCEVNDGPTKPKEGRRRAAVGPCLRGDGRQRSPNGWRAFIDSSGVMTDLGSFGGTSADFQGLALNYAGTVVGGEDLDAPIPLISRAFLFDGTGMHDLNTLIPAGTGWTLLNATGINDFDEIVGYGTVGGQTHAFLLTPVPEPGTMALLGTITGSAFYFRRRIIAWAVTIPRSVV
jgi:hypothetical protein